MKAFAFIAPMIMKFVTGINLDAFYTVVTKRLSRQYCYITMT